MDYSLHLYGEVRQHLRTVLQECAAANQRVAIYGRGEAAELAYVTLKEFGLEPVAVFERDTGGSFLGLPVRPIAEALDAELDALVIATFERPESDIAELTRLGVPGEKLLTLRRRLPAGGETSRT